METMIDGKKCPNCGHRNHSSDEPIEAESIEEFKANAKRLMLCDEIKVEFEKIGS